MAGVDGTSRFQWSQRSRTKVASYIALTFLLSENDRCNNPERKVKIKSLMRWVTMFHPDTSRRPGRRQKSSHNEPTRCCAGLIASLAPEPFHSADGATRGAKGDGNSGVREMNRIGGQSFICRRCIRRRSGRNRAVADAIGDDVRLKDRKDGDLCLGMTHEEVSTTIARNELRS